MENKMEKGVVKLSIEDAKKLYNAGNNFRIMALGAYSEEELKKPELPNTWEEFCENYPVQKGEVFIGRTCELIKASYYSSSRRKDIDKNLLPNKETAEAILALCQLIQLRDCYNQGWKPDWTDYSSKFIIKNLEGTLVKDSYVTVSFILAFKTPTLRSKFYDNFKDLLETAKELL